jgi:ribosome-binding protein aMBF1 (putative translation factor)
MKKIKQTEPIGKTLARMSEGQISNWNNPSELLASNPWRKVSIKIAYRMLQQMRSSGISASELAERVGSSPQYVGRVLKGTENLTLDTIGKFERALGIQLITVPKNELLGEVKFSITAEDMTYSHYGATEVSVPGRNFEFKL